MTFLRTSRRVAAAAVLAVSVAALLTSCSSGKKEETQEEQTRAAAAAVVAAAPKGPVIPKAYDDAAWQERFAYWYKKYLEMYQPVNEGLRVRVKLKNDGDVTGAYAGMTNNSRIIVATDSGVTNFAPDDMSEATREFLIETDFATANARREVEAERARGGTPPTTNEPPAADKVLEQRFSTTDAQGLDIRMGPGKNFKPVQNAVIQKGELISVVEDRDGWVRFKTPDTQGHQADVWVNKFSTLPQTDDNLPAQEIDIKTLQDDGILVEFDATNNLAKVNGELWSEMDFLVRQGVGRTLAFYCGTKRGTGLNWVEFKDSRSGKRIAKYSESQGLKIYNL